MYRIIRTKDKSPRKSICRICNSCGCGLIHSLTHARTHVLTNTFHPPTLRYDLTRGEKKHCETTVDVYLSQYLFTSIVRSFRRVPTLLLSLNLPPYYIQHARKRETRALFANTTTKGVFSRICTCAIICYSRLLSFELGAFKLV